MNVRELKARLAAFDDDVEVYAAPEFHATRVGESGKVVVAHPLHQYRVSEIHVVGDMDPESRKTGRRRLVISFHDPALSGRTGAAPIVARTKMQKRHSGKGDSMAWDVFYLERADLVRVDISGSFSTRALDTMFAELEASGCLRPGRSILFDDRALDLSRMTDTDVFAASEVFIRHAEAMVSSKVALVMGSIEGFRIACKFEFIAEARTNAFVQAFLDEHEALSWLLNEEAAQASS